MQELPESIFNAEDFVPEFALILGTRPLSQAEFEAILARLERSSRTFEMGPGSRKYVAALKGTLGRPTTNGN